MSSYLVNGLGTTDALAAVFSDTSILRSLLQVETALATTQAALGIIPASAAADISTAADPEQFDAASLVQEARKSGTVVIPLVAALRARVSAISNDSERYVHWGATSQDVSDTGLVLLLKQARPLIEDAQSRLEMSLRKRSDDHAHTLMVGRTLLQTATPITFGLKVAGWFAGIHRSGRRLASAFDEALIVQFAGAAGTLASLGEKGPAVRRGLARELGLKDAGGPWHTQRDRLAALACGCGVLTGAYGKTARDISLLMQDEIREASEPGGGSSAMPHKRNPAGCAVVLAAATRTPGLVAGFLSAMVQEHERSVGGWHAELPMLAELVQATGAAGSALAAVAEGLSVDPARMREHVAEAGRSLFSEQFMMLMTPQLGRRGAQELWSQLRDDAELADALPPGQVDQFGKPENYLGAAEELRQELLRTS